MLSKFFWAQWETPIKFDWTVEVRKNLIEFGVTNNLEEIKNMSKYSFNPIPHGERFSLHSTRSCLTASEGPAEHILCKII